MNLATKKNRLCIGIIALASGVGDVNYHEALDLLTAQGYNYKLSPTLSTNWGYFPGEDEFRAQELMKFFLDPEVDIILNYGGGYGSARILPYLDFELIKKHPKLFIGYSDITALLTNLNKYCGLTTVHGPMLKSFTRKFTKYTWDSFFKGLQGELKGQYPLPKGYHLHTIVEGEVTAPLIGGNLAILASLCGTPYQVEADGKILFLEEVNEQAYAIDRMLNQLEQAGVTRDLAGLIWGKFAKCGPNKQEEYEFTVQEVIEYYSRRWKVPTISNLPVGHLAHNGFLPLGINYKLKADTEPSLEIMDGYLKA